MKPLKVIYDPNFEEGAVRDGDLEELALSLVEEFHGDHSIGTSQESVVHEIRFRCVEANRGLTIEDHSIEGHPTYTLNRFGGFDDDWHTHRTSTLWRSIRRSEQIVRIAAERRRAEARAEA